MPVVGKKSHLRDVVRLTTSKYFVLDPQLAWPHCSGVPSSLRSAMEHAVHRPYPAHFCQCDIVLVVDKIIVVEL